MKASTLFKTLAIDIADMSGAARLLKPLYAGRGAILAFHSIQPLDEPVFVPGNVVRSEQLRATLSYLVKNDFEIVSLDEVPERLRRNSRGVTRFVAITLDDGYRDNLIYALPIFKEFSAPFTLFPATGFVDRTKLYWPALMRTLFQHTGRITLRHPDGRTVEYPCASHDEKLAATSGMAQSGWSEVAIERSLSESCVAHGLNPYGITGEVFLSWAELELLAKDPLATIGVHTISHASLAGLPAHEMVREMSVARDELKSRLGVEIRHIAYPYGACSDREFKLAREMGFLTGVTTHRGNLHERHQFSLLSLPRHTLSMCRHSANVRYLRASLNGIWDSPLNGSIVRR